MEEFRQKILAKMDDVLARTFLVRGDDRKMLSAFRDLVAAMDEATLQVLHGFYATKRGRRRKK